MKSNLIVIAFKAITAGSGLRQDHSERNEGYIRVFVVSLVSYICVDCQIPNKIRSLLGSVLSLIDALQGVPIVCKPIGVFLLC